MTTKFAVMLATMIAFAVKVGAWAIYGPVTFNDTVLYETFANMLLQDDWSWQYDFFNETVPVTGLRTIGYPSVLAVAQMLVGDEWRHAVIGVQIAVSLLSVAMATHWACRLTASPFLALFTGLTLGLGQTALYDTALLPDSLFSSLAIMILCALSAPREDERQSGKAVGTALLCGLGAAAMCLLRANGLHIAILFAPLAIVWLADNRKGRFLPALALVLPVLITLQGYMYWNQSRTGVRFLSTGAQIAAFQPLFEMAQHGTDVFTDDSVLSKTVRDTTSSFDYADIGALNNRLAADHGWTSVDIADAGTAAFIRACLTEPIAMLQNAGRAFGFTIIRALFNPALAVNETHHLITQERLFPGASKMLKSLSAQSPVAVFYIFTYVAGAVVSTILFALFLIGVPLKCLKLETAGRCASILALWTGIIGMLAYYSLIHLEYRYVLATVPLMAGLGLWALPERWLQRMTPSGSVRPPT